MASVITPYVRASYPLIYMVTAEENRAEQDIIATAEELERRVCIWSCTEGLVWPGEDESDSDATDPMDALEKIKDAPEGAIFILRDIHDFLRAPPVKRHLRDIAKDFKNEKKTVVMLSPINELVPDLERDCVLIEYKLPDRDMIASIFDELCAANKKNEKRAPLFASIDADERNRIIDAAMGLTSSEAEGAFAKSLVEMAQFDENDEDRPTISELVMKEKAEAVRKSGILEYSDTPIKANNIGGLDVLKKWLDVRGRAFSPKAREFGLPMPRGILLVGLPGCGKSLTAKAASNILKVPLIRFDIGRVFGGLVGQSEQNMRTAIQTIEAIGRCVVWIDEMEKAFAGIGSSGSTDSGVTARVFGNFITWMQEKKAPSFIIATSNNIDNIPPEMLRKGRFDEIFFCGLPSREEREEILKIHVRNKGREAENFSFAECAEESNEFSGAELEEAVVTGLYQAYYEDREITDEDILRAIIGTTPLSESKKKELDRMKSWAEKNAVNASVESANGKKKKKKGPAARVIS